tara:strand:- start:10559 stop:11296 length:738 start_codon:yes stop_codon:yes gene_type:complete
MNQIKKGSVVIGKEIDSINELRYGDLMYRNMQKVLAIGAHFDDVELGAGGTLAKLANNRAKVYKLVLTDDVTNFDQKKIKTDFESSRKEGESAANILGITQIEPSRYEKCTKLEFNSINMQLVEKIIFDYSIDTVFTHFLSDIQQDHVEASKISYVAARYCKRVLFYQSNRYILPKDFYPRIFFDITKEVDKKIKALNCFSKDHDRFGNLFQQTIKQNEVWGYQSILGSKTNFAEGFVPLKMVID